MFFHLIKRPPFFTTSKGTQLLVFPIFYIIFLFPTSYLPRVFFLVCVILCSILITELEFELYGIFSPCSWHVVRLRSNIFSFKVWLASIFSSTWRHQMFSLTMISNFYIVHPCQPQQHLLTSWSTVCHCAQCDHCDQL